VATHREGLLELLGRELRDRGVVEHRAASGPERGAPFLLDRLQQAAHLLLPGLAER